MSVPAFIEIDVNEQSEELRAYFKSLGAEISEERSPRGLEDDLHKIIGVCDSCFKDPNDVEIEGVLNSIVSMLIMVPVEKSENLILSFCEKLSKAPSNRLGVVCLKVLNLLFHGLEEKSSVRFHVYYHLVQIAGQTDQITTVFSTIQHMKRQLGQAQPSPDQMQKLLRLLHEVLLESGKSHQASTAMIELLGTYTTENASEAREEAQRCIIASLADPNTFMLDHLLALKPVRFLEGQLIHDLLTVFVSDQLHSYQHFYQNHREFVTGQGLIHEANMRKMRLLTFMQMAETQMEMNFDTIQQNLELGADDVEGFIIDVIKTKLVRARMDQAARKVYISSTMHRTFGRQQWQQVHDILASWKTNLHSVKGSMTTVVAAQLEQAVPNKV